MPTFENIVGGQPSSAASGPAIQFPPVTRDHILHCSYDYWFPKYRTSCLKSRIVELPPEFVEYLREDGIALADDEGAKQQSDSEQDDDDDWEPSIPTGVFQARPGDDGGDSGSDEEDDDARPTTVRLPPNKRFPILHEQIKQEIQFLGGEVVPKLNWSSPKDATWIMMEKNTMLCRTPNDIYLLLKSSSFISHDLEHAFDGCIPLHPWPSSTARCAAEDATAESGVDGGDGSASSAGVLTRAGLGFKPVLVLRPYFKPQPALEFRCFVKHRNLVAISQRDLKHYPFLEALRPTVVTRVKKLFDNVLRFTFPDGCFTFDVYIPEGEGDDDDDNGAEGSGGRLSRARLIDINPWAGRTDPLLFDWEELLDLRVPRPVLGTTGEQQESYVQGTEGQSDTGETADEDEADDFEPELRLVGEDDPIASNFLSSQYSAHQLPKEVVDASMAGKGGLREFAEQWRQLVERGAGIQK